MGEYLRSCERSAGEMVLMEVNSGGAKTRTVEEVTSSIKKRKTDDSELVNLPEESPFSGSASPANSTFTSHDVSSYDVVKNNNLRSTDLKPSDSETEIYMFTTGEFRKTSQLSELCGGDSEEVMESLSTTKKKSSPKNSHRKCAAVEMPSATEIEEFFSAAENYELQRFTEKYNYDIVKDVPLEGRYQWIRLKP